MLTARPCDPATRSPCIHTNCSTITLFLFYSHIPHVTHHHTALFVLYVRLCSHHGHQEKQHAGSSSCWYSVEHLIHSLPEVFPKNMPMGGQAVLNPGCIPTSCLGVPGKSSAPSLTRKTSLLANHE